MHGRIEKFFLKLIPIIGIVLLLKQYFINRSLWFDETLVAEDIINLPIILFFHQPLPNHQIAPVSFLIIEKLFVRVGGVSEYALRFYQLICGCLSIFLFSAWAKKRLKDNFFVIIAVLAFIFLPTVIYFSCEVKPYSQDLLFVLVAYTVIAEAVVHGFGWGKVIGAGLLGAVLLWGSFPVAFVLASIGITQFLSAAFQRRWGKLFKSFIAVLCWALSLCLIYFIVLRHSLGNDHFFTSFFKNYFIKFNDYKTYLNSFKNILQYHAFASYGALQGFIWVLVLLGFYFLYQDNKTWFFFLFTQVLLAVIASGMHLYPLGERVSLYLVPLIVLLIVRGIQGVSLWAGRFKWIIALLISGIVFNQALTKTWGELITPTPSWRSRAWGIENYGPVGIRSSIDYIKSQARTGDIVYVDSDGISGFKYYQLRDPVIVDELDQKRLDRIPDNDLNVFRGNKRVWVFYLSVNTGLGRDFSKKFLRHRFLESGAQLIDNRFDGGAGIYLFDCSHVQAKEKTKN